ncbi:hypothetical protein B0H14DRAFT_3686708 [Mycena olivaceomarginata]|nr:hypothetical protein B0H14DRAFT_3686708 [Mycena olivaceomarginata]
MPAHPSGKTSSGNSVVTYATSAAGVSLLILETVELVESIYDILRALINLCADAEALLSPALLQAIADFAETLQKIQAYMSAQLGMRSIKRFLRAAENTIQLDECNAGLDRALVQFKVHIDITSMKTVLEMDADDEKRHQELLALIKSQANPAGSIWSLCSSSSTSSLLLPPRPQIFHGRDTELATIVSTLVQPSAFPRITILGPGGIGKTALVSAALHHSEVEARFAHRYFVSCESASGSADVVLALAAQLGVSAQSGQALKEVLQRLSSTVEPTLLVLDNLESAWEAPEGRVVLLNETFFLVLGHYARRRTPREGSLDAAIPPPLEPLSRDAALQTLFDIVGDDSDSAATKQSQIDQALDLTDNLPLALTLLGALISLEGYAPTIARWHVEHTALLSDGPVHTSSNLNHSIALSLSSPRIVAAPGARELLGVLSLLPGGILENELGILGPPIPNLGHGRLKTLAPVREYVRATIPPAPALVQPLLRFVYALLGLWSAFRQLPSGDLVPRLKTESGNLRSLFIYAVQMQGQSKALFGIPIYGKLTDAAPADVVASCAYSTCSAAWKCSSSIESPVSATVDTVGMFVGSDDARANGGGDRKSSCAMHRICGRARQEARDEFVLARQIVEVEGEVWKELAYAFGMNFGLVFQVISIFQALPTTACRPPRAPHAPAPLHKHMPLLILLRHCPHEPHPHTRYAPIARHPPVEVAGMASPQNKMTPTPFALPLAQTPIPSRVAAWTQPASARVLIEVSMRGGTKSAKGGSLGSPTHHRVSITSWMEHPNTHMYRDVILFCGAPPHIGTRVAEKAVAEKAGGVACKEGHGGREGDVAGGGWEESEDAQTSTHIVWASA